jgi:hypothetical protein
MGIARTIERVKRQAKQGGLGAVRATLGEELRSSAIPAPLRSAAQRLAALLDPARSPEPAPSTVYQVSYEQAGRSAPANENERKRPHADPASSAQRLEEVSLTSPVRPPEHVTTTGNDSGAAPDEPAPELEVDPSAVGATPTFDATPVEAAALDATPREAAPIDATPALIEPLTSPTREPHATAKPDRSEPSHPKAKARTDGPRKPAAAKSSATHPKKEKLADHGEAAKSVARSSSRGAKQRTSPKADTTSKKK